MNNSRILVTVTADYIEDKRQETSLCDIHEIIHQTSNHISELDQRRLDRVAHELANRNACHWLYQTLAKQYNMETLEKLNRRLSDPFQGDLRNRMNLTGKAGLNLMGLSGFSSIPHNHAFSKGN